MLATAANAGHNATAAAAGLGGRGGEGGCAEPLLESLAEVRAAVLNSRRRSTPRQSGRGGTGSDVR